MNAKKILWVILITSSLASLIFLLYTLNLFLKLYIAVRMVDVNINEFNIDITNDNATINILVTISNPSEFTFKWVRITQKLYLNGEFFLISRKELKELPASTNATIIFNLEVPFYKVDLIRGSNKKYWDITYYIWFRIPITENTYNLHFKRKIVN